MELESDPESDADEAGATPAAAKAARGPAPSSGLPANWQEMWGGTGLGRGDEKSPQCGGNGTKDTADIIEDGHGLAVSSGVAPLSEKATS